MAPFYYTQTSDRLSILTHDGITCIVLNNHPKYDELKELIQGLTALRDTYSRYTQNYVEHGFDDEAMATLRTMEQQEDTLYRHICTLAREAAFRLEPPSADFRRQQAERPTLWGDTTPEMVGLPYKDDKPLDEEGRNVLLNTGFILDENDNIVGLEESGPKVFGRMYSLPQDEAILHSHQVLTSNLSVKDDNPLMEQKTISETNSTISSTIVSRIRDHIPVNYVGEVSDEHFVAALVNSFRRQGVTKIDIVDEKWLGGCLSVSIPVLVTRHSAEG